MENLKYRFVGIHAHVVVYGSDSSHTGEWNKNIKSIFYVIHFYHDSTYTCVAKSEAVISYFVKTNKLIPRLLLGLR